MRQTISILHCFDNNFVVPAGVAIHSLLKHADTAFDYRIHVLHSNISDTNQARLKAGISGYPHAELVFMNMENRCAQLFDDTRTKGHYSKEMFYKLLAPTLFPDLDKILVSDVDVVFLGDISRDFLGFDAEGDLYLAGSPSLVKRGSWVDKVMRAYEGDFTAQEVKALKIGAGYYMANLRKMRTDGLEEKMLRFAADNSQRLRQPEQDVLNLVCFPNIGLLPADSMVCTYSYEFYLDEADLSCDLNYPAEEVRRALRAPIQLHYAGSVKPWNRPDSTKSEVWYETLVETPFLRDQLAVLGECLDRMRKRKDLFSFGWPRSGRRIVVSRVKP